MDWQITGHKRQLDFLEKTMATGKVAHGYLFVGPAGVGKHAVALKMAEKLLGTASFSPDLIELKKLEDKNEITIEPVRDLLYKLALKPYAAPYKVAIIENAEQLNTAAANAMLKVLEEPKPNTVIILTASNSARLPKTIVSRTQKINFGLVK